MCNGARETDRDRERRQGLDWTGHPRVMPYIVSSNSARSLDVALPIKPLSLIGFIMSGSINEVNLTSSCYLKNVQKRRKNTKNCPSYQQCNVPLIWEYFLYIRGWLAPKCRTCRDIFPHISPTTLTQTTTQLFCDDITHCLHR